MREAAVRLRVAIMMTGLITLAWALVSILGRPSGAFTQRELPDVAGLPITVPQIQRLIPPQASDIPTPGVAP
ncbi:MAG: hypothetical protein ACYDCC_12755 [Actinomycetota bacterium]